MGIKTALQSSSVHLDSHHKHLVVTFGFMVSHLDGGRLCLVNSGQAQRQNQHVFSLLYNKKALLSFLSLLAVYLSTMSLSLFPSAAEAKMHHVGERNRERAVQQHVLLSSTQCSFIL